MKKVLWVLFCIFVFNIVFGLSVANKMKDIFGEELFSNFALSGASASETLKDDEVNKKIIDIKYIKRDGTVDTRQMILYTPTNVSGDLPIIYIPHYAAEENKSDFVNYIKHGWAVASTYNFKSDYNGTLVLDDLTFNNAALYTIRHMDGIDKERIVLVGGSAGGYMTLMLNGLQMGTTAALANSPISNAYYNAYIYFPACDELNRNSGLFKFTMPIQGLVSKSFQTSNNIIGDDYKTWEAVSPISLASSMSNTLVITHNTSDILVPIDQLTHKYTYEHNDGTLPKGFDLHLGTDYPGKLSKTFEEMANSEELIFNYNKYDNFVVSGDLPYSDKLITIDIIDDGAPTAKGSHANPKLTGNYNIFSYLEEMMNKTLKETEVLVKDKLELILDRYNGNSIALPAHEGVDDTIYGSLEIYKKEIIDELQTYVNNHSLYELDNVMQEVIKDNEDYKNTWNEIKNKLN